MYTHTDGRQFGTGAKYVKKDYFSSLKVGRASAPFDWQGGFIDGIPSSIRLVIFFIVVFLSISASNP